MQDQSTPDPAATGLVRTGLRRVAVVVGSLFAAVALVASLAVAPQASTPEDTAGDSATELIAGPSWGFSVQEGDVTPGDVRKGAGTWGPSWG